MVPKRYLHSKVPKNAICPCLRLRNIKQCSICIIQFHRIFVSFLKHQGPGDSRIPDGATHAVRAHAGCQSICRRSAATPHFPTTKHGKRPPLAQLSLSQLQRKQRNLQNQQIQRDTELQNQMQNLREIELSQLPKDLQEQMIEFVCQKIIKWHEKTKGNN